MLKAWSGRNFILPPLCLAAGILSVCIRLCQGELCCMKDWCGSRESREKTHYAGKGWLVMQTGMLSVLMALCTLLAQKPVPAAVASNRWGQWGQDRAVVTGWNAFSTAHAVDAPVRSSFVPATARQNGRWRGHQQTGQWRHLCQISRPTCCYLLREAFWLRFLCFYYVIIYHC